MKTLTGITTNNAADVAGLLNQLLADEFTLYVKTLNAHWNVEGKDFYYLHKFFEEQYIQLQETIDDIAERIRSIGHFPVATMSNFLQLTHLSEKTGEKNDSLGFIKELLNAHESIILNIRKHIHEVDSLKNDSGSSDLMTGIIKDHEKISWMLRAHLS